MVDTPEPGFFLFKLVKGGWPVAALLSHDNGLWCATVNGETKRPHEDPALAEDVMRVWHYGRRTTEAEYQHRLALKTWAERDQPDHPAANPREPVDFHLLRVSLF